MPSRTAIDLTGKVALVTGASRGIGREAAMRMGLAGARIAVNYFHSEAEARALVLEIGGHHAMAVRADVGQPAQIEAMIEVIVRHFGRIDILVNNAAPFARNSFDGNDYAAWQRGWQRTFE